LNFRPSLRFWEPVTICNLLICKLKRKIIRKPVAVAFKGLVQLFRLDAIDFRQVCIEDHADIANTPEFVTAKATARFL
jgi:hypothetical protein